MVGRGTERWFLTARQVREAMEPFDPYRGLAVFYMMVDFRLKKIAARPT